MGVIEKLRDVSKGVVTLADVKMDGWQNFMTGLGTLTRDKLANTFFLKGANLDDDTLEGLFDGDDMAARIVEKLPDEAMREGFKINIKPDDETDASAVEEVNDTADALKMLLEDIGAEEKLNEAWVWGRLFGGGACYMLTDDPGAPDDELDLENLKAITGLLVIDKRDIYPIEFEVDLSSPRFGLPTIYQVTRSGSASVQAAQPLLRVHWSRLITFEGVRTTKRRKAENDGWSNSVLQRVNTVLRNFNVGWDSTAHLLTDSAQGVLKMDGLMNMLAAGGKALVQERLTTVDMGRSVARMMVLDADKESFERQETNFTGTNSVLQSFMIRLAAAADMPVTILMGQSPAGMNATGESDFKAWENTIASQQTRVLLPALTRLVQVVMRSKDGPTGGLEPNSWAIEFNPLRQMTEGETADLRKKVAETDHIYITDGVVLPEEVTLSRFRANGFSMETSVDLELRKKILELESERELEKVENPPIPPGMPGGPPMPPVPGAPAPPPAPPGAEPTNEDPADPEEEQT